jgi:hypothetical protein
VLLKQSGAAPAAGGLDGLRDELAPAVWHEAQTAALLVSAVVWVLAPKRESHGFAACGEFTPAP